MSRKTVVKLLLSKWGPQSTEMQKAFRVDQAAMGDDDAYNYVDNKPDQDEHSDGSSAPQSQKMVWTLRRITNLVGTLLMVRS